MRSTLYSVRRPADPTQFVIFLYIISASVLFQEVVFVAGVRSCSQRVLRVEPEEALFFVRALCVVQSSLPLSVLKHSSTWYVVEAFLFTFHSLPSPYFYLSLLAASSIRGYIALLFTPAHPTKARALHPLSPGDFSPFFPRRLA